MYVSLKFLHPFLPFVHHFGCDRLFLPSNNFLNPLYFPLNFGDPIVQIANSLPHQIHAGSILRCFLFFFNQLSYLHFIFTWLCLLRVLLLSRTQIIVKVDFSLGGHLKISVRVIGSTLSIYLVSQI